MCGPLLVPVQANQPPVVPTAAMRARDQVFALLEKRSGRVERVSRQELLDADPDEERWQHKRLEAAGDDLRVVAGLLHLDLQKAEVLLSTRDKALQTRGLLLASNAVLYVALLEDDDGDARLRAALYEGFLLPFVDAAPGSGRHGRFALLEGGAVALGDVGNTGGSMAVLDHIVKTAPNKPQSDMARVHLVDALAASERYSEAHKLLQEVTTPDLEGAKLRSGELWRKYREQQQKLRARLIEQSRVAGGGAGTTGTETTAPASTGATGATGTGGGAITGGVPGLAGGGLLLPGRRVAQAGIGGAGQAPETADANAATEEAEIEEPATQAEAEEDLADTPLGRARRAAKAAQKASLLSRRAQDMATISLARLLDAADAQQAFETAIAGPARTRNARANPNAPVLSLDLLETEAGTKSRLASKSAAEAEAASLEAQEATKIAAQLALLVHSNAANTRLPAAPIPDKAVPDPANELPTAVEVPTARALAPANAAPTPAR